MPQKKKLFPTNLEFRSAIEFRAEPTGTDKIIKGYAVPFNIAADIGGFFMETFLPGAFTKTITEFDQKVLWAHDDQKPLASRLSGNLLLREEVKGLYFEAKLNDTSWAVDGYEAIKNGDVKKVSIGFSVIQELKRIEGEGRDQIYYRDIVEAKLWELSPVIWPAFDDTNVQARSIFESIFPKDFTDKPITEPEGIHSADHLAAEIAEKVSRESIQRSVKIREFQLRILEN